ncbi:hypothetical protein FGE12_25940 [Aggregicoccus sp. 17bor-14]|uniref:Ig-like domain-containing protein n=1 Tax=Myxococcaceae TaxID=31 RepID=UPI00129CC8E1|nr:MULTISPECIES: Ig-like domain-containing protein [Myxococcaceae]MBF5045878.1 Ig-like domain-containing protein [Simulacricoccus sp. 17bor-14]MRI91612.1 hypothetical protein [Aggregicoccus sp. 17bor-14]
MWRRRSASLSFLVLQLSLALTAAGCIDFDAERARYCSGGGSGCLPAVEGEGGPDAGPDAGPPPAALSLQAVPASQSQRRRVGDRFALAVSVTDAQGAGVAGVAVHFSAPALEGPSGTFAGALALTVQTDAQGVASAELTSNAVAGAFEVRAEAEGAEGTASFALTTVVPAPSTLELLTPTSLDVPVGGTLPTVRARVLDQLGEVLVGSSISFDMPTTLAGASWPGGTRHLKVVSNLEGLVESPSGTANTVAGGYEVALSSAGGEVSVSVPVRNLPAAPTHVQAPAASALSTPVMQAFPASAFTVLDRYENPVPGHTLRLTTRPTSSSAWARFGTGDTAVVTSGADGRFTLPTLTANQFAGSFLLEAFLTQADILPNSSFSLEQVAGPAAQLAIVSGDAQGTLVGSLFLPLAVSVKDAWGNPVRTGRVGFTSPPELGTTSPTALFGPSGSASATSLSVDLAGTDTPGVAQVTPRANATPAGTTYAVTAQYESSATLKVLFKLANDKYSLRLSPNTAQTLTDDASVQLSVRVLDVSNGAVAALPLVFEGPMGYGAFPASPAADKLTLEQSTNNTGDASAQWNSNHCTVPPYTVDVHVMDPKNPSQPLLAFPARFNLQNASTSTDC